MTSQERRSMQIISEMATSVVSVDDKLFQQSIKFAAQKLKLSGELKLQQCHAIRHVLKRRDLFVNLSTGGCVDEGFQSRTRTLPQNAIG